MMKTKELEPEQVAFIKANYLQMSINEMAATIDSNFSRVRKCMRENNLEVDPEIYQKFRKRIKDKKQMPKSSVTPFWNYNLNPITMY